MRFEISTNLHRYKRSRPGINSPNVFEISTNLHRYKRWTIYH
nr:MAG TPA: hypothetical protein [Caudoviricetes sp.]DAG98401.1 MAG TPA: hypothetical protein [Herelleviridae sp.]